jgi:hypothetical protein
MFFCFAQDAEPKATKDQASQAPLALMVTLTMWLQSGLRVRLLTHTILDWK